MLSPLADFGLHEGSKVDVVEDPEDWKDQLEEPDVHPPAQQSQN